MENVQFDEPEYAARQAPVLRKQGLVGLVQQWGLAKSDKQAAILLLIVAIASAAAAVAVLFFSKDSAPPPPQFKEGQSVFLPPAGGR